MPYPQCVFNVNKRSVMARDNLTTTPCIASNAALSSLVATLATIFSNASPSSSFATLLERFLGVVSQHGRTQCFSSLNPNFYPGEREN
jgi:hypothetical protein